MSKGKTEKPCGRCGVGKVLTGERSKYNAKDKSGRQVCSGCVMEDLLAPFTTKR